MKYTYSTELSQEHCESVIRNNVDLISFSLDGGDFVGWIKKGFFSISTSRGMLKSDLVRNKVLGRISVKDNKTHVTFRTSRGYTDVVSIVTMWVLSFLCMIIIDLSTGEVSMTWKLLFPSLLSLIVAFVSLIVSHASEDGQENEELLVEFLIDGLELTPLKG